MPRLFTGIVLPELLKQHLGFLKAPLPGAKWIDLENLHLTLRFAGDLSASEAREFHHALARVSCSPFEVRVQGLGVFGGKTPTALWADIAASPPLAELARQHERAARQAGLAPEPRKFKAHITLARLRHTRPDRLVRYLESNGGFASQPFLVESFALFSARPRTGGGPYVVEDTFPLYYDGPSPTQANALPQI